MADKARLRAGTPADAPAPESPQAGGRIECENVYKWFPGGIVLEDVSLTVEAGQFVCIVGPSGCGKTTLLRMMGGLAEADHGRVTIGGTAVTGPGSPGGRRLPALWPVPLGRASTAMWRFRCSWPGSGAPNWTGGQATPSRPWARRA